MSRLAEVRAAISEEDRAKLRAITPWLKIGVAVAFLIAAVFLAGSALMATPDAQALAVMAVLMCPFVIVGAVLILVHRVNVRESREQSAMPTPMLRPVPPRPQIVASQPASVTNTTNYYIDTVNVYQTGEPAEQPLTAPADLRRIHPALER